MSASAPTAHEEYTLVIVKPDALRDRPAFSLLAAIERETDARVVGVRMGQFPRALFAQHYAEHKEKPFYGALLDRMAAGVCIVVAFRGVAAVSRVRESVLRVRRQYGVQDAPENLLHASDSLVPDARREVSLWFPFLAVTPTTTGDAQ